MRFSDGISAAVLAMLAGAVACRGAESSVASPGQPSGALSTLIGEADLVIVGRIKGLADSAPDAQRRRHLEIHLIDVEQTLKGPDHSGQELAARPNGAVWKDGVAYVLLLQSAPGNVVRALSQPRLEATDAQIAVVRGLVQDQGGAVTEQRIMWMRHQGGSGGGPIVEFFVTVSGQFEWRRLVNPERSGDRAFETLSGSLPSEQVSDLVRRIQDIDPGPPTDDGDVALFGWLGENRARRLKSCSTPARTACSSLLEAIEILARRHAGSLP